MEKADAILEECSRHLQALRKLGEELTPLTGWSNSTVFSMMAAAINDDEQLGLLRNQMVRDRIHREALAKLSPEEREVLFPKDTRR